MPASTISSTSTYIPRAMKTIVSNSVDDIDDPEDFMKTLIRSTTMSDLPKMTLAPRSYKIIGTIIKDSRDLDRLFISDDYKAHLKKRGRHANQDIRIIMKMIAERYVIISSSKEDVGIVMSMRTTSMSEKIAMKPHACASFRPLSYAETEHIITIRYRIGKMAIYVDMTLADVIHHGRHLITTVSPNDAFSCRHVNTLVTTRACTDTFSIRCLAQTARDVFGSNDFDRPMKHLLDDPRPINIVVLTEHVTTVTTFLKDILVAIFGEDAHVPTKAATCNYVYEYAKGYKEIAAEFEDEYGAPGVILYSPHFMPASVDQAMCIFSSITVVMDIEDAGDAPEDVERVIVTAEPKKAYHSSRPTYKDLRDYVTYLRNVDTESEGDE